MYDDDKKKSVIVDAKSPFLGRSFGGVDLKNRDKYSFYDRRLRRSAWSAEVHTIICSPSGIIPECSRQALKALKLDAPSIRRTLENINIDCVKAGYSIRKSLGSDRPRRDKIHRPRAARHRRR
jgi:hypothetical protein